MKILILWASLADYTIACFRELAKQEGVVITLVYQPSKSIAPFEGLDLSFCKASYEDKGDNWREMISKLNNSDIDIVLMASWNYKHYMSLSKKLRQHGKPVISAFDNQWNGGLRQQIGRLISPFFLKPVINNFLVPGDRQAQFAYRLGYGQPLQGFYCANDTNFKTKQSSLTARKFIFVGRFVEQKGVSQLVEAYQHYRREVSNPWSLVMVGEGPLKSKCNNIEGISVLPFAQPKDLSFLLTDASCFVLPSVHENWGLVIHEAALAGLPIICSSSCGASTWMLRDGQNGYLIAPKEYSIKTALVKIHEASSEELSNMGKLSYELGSMWTTERWAKHIYKSFEHYNNA